MNIELMKAILAMDSYNRGYNQSIVLSDSPDSIAQNIGSAIIVRESDIANGSEGVNIGFYALAYDYNGQTIISYRGTDYPTADSALSTPKDILHGWPLGGGFTNDRRIIYKAFLSVWRWSRPCLSISSKSTPSFSKVPPKVPSIALDESGGRWTILDKYGQKISLFISYLPS